MDSSQLSAMPWHALDARDVAERLATDLDAGLSKGEAASRLDRHGRNEIRRHEAISGWRILTRQFADPLIYVLIAAAGLTVVTGDYVDAAIIGVVVVLNAAIGFVQEFRARKAIQSLAEMAAPRAVVVRGGQRAEVETPEVVPGDVVELSTGGAVPADVRLVDVHDLRVDESALTGESAPVDKSSTAVEDEDAVPADQSSMAFAGTSITRGHARGIVVRTGSMSELGKIAEQTEDVGDVETPIKKKMDKLGRLIAIGIVVLAAVAVAVGTIRGAGLDVVVETAIAMAVGAVPEALPIVLTVTLAIGAKRMVDRDAIVRSLPAIETLGSTTVVGSDKTGTLTANEMTVRTIWTRDGTYDVEGAGYDLAGEINPSADAAPLDQNDALHQTLLAGLLANETEHLPEDERPTGDPTELAVLISAAKAGLEVDETRRRYPRRDLVPFESERQLMATLHDGDDAPRRAYVKGSPEAVLERCDEMLMADGSTSALDASQVEEAAHELAKDGLRVLAMAYRDEDAGELDHDEIGGGFVFVGLQGMEDPLRPETKDAVSAAREAGIRVVMLTGDHADTAQSIGRQLDLRADRVVRGSELERMTDEELDDAARQTDIYARVAPEHKLRLVERLRKHGEIVAVTGDGVNDAPALQAAHLGIAMGRSGTDVAREAADMILTDDNFASITSAIEEGRVAFENIRKVTYFLLSTGLGEVLAIMTSLFLGIPLPFLAVQVLWINLVTNGLQDVALAFEKGEPDLAKRPPRDPSEQVINREVLWRLFTVASLTAAATLGVFWWVREQGATMELARSVAMTQMVMFQFLHVFNSRSMRASLFRVPLRNNPFLIATVVFAIGAHIGALHLPFMQSLLGTTSLPLEYWGLTVAVGTLIIVLVEGEKLFLRRAEGEPDEAKKLLPTRAGARMHP